MTPRSLLVTTAFVATACLVACTPSPAQEGEQLFAERCTTCHTPAGTGRAAGTGLLQQLSPRAIVAVLEDGVMRVEGSSMTAEQRIQVAEYLTGRSYTAEAIPEAAFCANPAAWNGMDPSAVSWTGFAGNLAGTGYQPPERAGLDASDVPKLELRWAFAFPDGTNMRTSPAVAGDAALVAGPFGEVLALDLATGCVRWSFEADAVIRGAIAVGEGPEGRSTAWFVDSRTNAYAVDLASGSLLWKHRVGWHAAAYGTGSPALHDGRLFVPVSSLEVAVAGDPRHECCTSSMVHDVRIIRLGEPKRLPKHIRPWMGDSWGRWVGDTLVVETTNLHPNQSLQGIPPSEDIRVIERFTRASENRIHYEFTVDDPLMFEHPWSGEVPFNRLDGLVYEYACHEGNYALENVLRGARAEERRK